MIDKSRNNELRFSFIKLANMDNHTKWTQKIHYLFRFTVFQNYILLDNQNLKLAPIIQENEKVNHDIKLERLEKHSNKIIF